MPLDKAQLLADIEETIERVALRSFCGYGTDDDRAYWAVWLADLRAKRDQLKEELDGEVGTAGA